MMGAASTAVQTAAIAAAIGLGFVAAFQLAIALGAPLGPGSWGGTHEGVLPPNLRIASAVAAPLWAFAALVVLGRAGLGPLSGGWLEVATWILVGVLVLGVLMNAASKSRWERFGWAPFTLVLALLCLAVARS
jgi:hypothetical protein